MTKDKLLCSNTPLNYNKCLPL